MFLRVCTLSLRDGRCQGLLVAQHAGVSLDVVCSLYPPSRCQRHSCCVRACAQTTVTAAPDCNSSSSSSVVLRRCSRVPAPHRVNPALVVAVGRMFGFLMPCWYSYSYHNNQYIFGQGDMTCLRSSKIILKPSKMIYPLRKHPNILMPYKVIPRYGLGARMPNGTTTVVQQHPKAHLGLPATSWLRPSSLDTPEYNLAVRTLGDDHVQQTVVSLITT